MESFRNFINNEHVPSSGPMLFTASPYSGEIWAEVPDDPAAVDLAVTAARAAFESGPWRSMPATSRAALMVTLGELLSRDATMLSEVESRDNGKIIGETSAQATRSCRGTHHCRC